MKIIGVFAQLAGGKDTVANHLVETLNGGVDPQKWFRLGFADAVKHVYMESFGVTWDWIEEWKRKPEIPPGFDLTVRQGLQHIGDGFRKIQADVWIRKAMRDHAIISDGRYLNEAKMIKEQGGFNILLWRPGFENNDPNPSESQIRPYIDFAATNYKEGPLSDLPFVGGVTPECLHYFDYFLINNGTKEDLYGKIDNGVLHYLQETGIK